MKEIRGFVQRLQEIDHGRCQDQSARREANPCDRSEWRLFACAEKQNPSNACSETDEHRQVHPERDDGTRTQPEPTADSDSAADLDFNPEPTIVPTGAVASGGARPACPGGDVGVVESALREVA